MLTGRRTDKEEEDKGELLSWIISKARLRR